MDTRTINRNRYQSSNNVWPDDIPPLSRIEAERAMKRLARHFKFRVYGPPRRCWITAKPPFGKLHRGWRRMVHDLSHRWFDHVYRNKRTHDPLHSRYEAEMVAYVLESGWLNGTLKPREKAKPSADERRSAKVASIADRLARWRTKAKRAQTAIKKLERQLKRYKAAA